MTMVTFEKCRKICTTKDPLSLHLRAKQHSFVDDATTPEESDSEENGGPIINVISYVTKVPGQYIGSDL